MSGLTGPEPPAVPDATALASDDLLGFLREQPWFRSRSADPPSARVLESVPMREDAPQLAISIVEVAVEHGRSELYHLPLGFRPVGAGWREGVVGEVEGHVAYDALADPELVLAFETAIVEGREVREGEIALELAPVAPASGTALGHTLRVYRRLAAGTHPELEMLRFLTEHGFPNAAPLLGACSYSSRLIDATLALAQQRVPVTSDGWTLALDSIATPTATEGFLAAVHRLGLVTRELHELLASQPGDADFAPETASTESLALLEATLDEEIASVFSTLPDDEALAPIAGRGEEVRDELRARSRAAYGRSLIRVHGDYHLGNVFWTGGDWLLEGFGGEPGRTLADRRRKASPLRDLATMLRSIGYVAAAAAMEGVEPPLGWEARARYELVSGYFERADTAEIVPGGGSDAESLLALFELERAVHELRHELAHRPEWVGIPAAAIGRLLDARTTLAV